MIEAKGLFKTYQLGDTQVKALDDVSVRISSGEFVAIMGASGSGKSTLMHVLGLLDRPDQGDYYLAGENITHLSDQELAMVRNRLVGFVFQQFHLLPRMSAIENTNLPLVYAGEKHLKHKAEQAITQVGLQTRMFHKPNQLSGGQQQRVAIARSLVNDPPIIFADEPTGNLDTKSKDEIMLILQQLNRQGKTIVMVTHEPEIAAFASRVITMRDGKVISDTQTQSVENKSSENEEHQKTIQKMLQGFQQSKRSAMDFFDYFKQAMTAMFSHKMRAFLSILGVLIGVAAVIAMLAIGQGAKESIEKQLASLGSNLLLVRPGASRSGGVSLQSGITTRFTLEDVVALEKLKEYVHAASPSVSGRVQIVYKNKNWNSQLEGVAPSYENLRASVPILGRFFSDEEMKMREKVVLLGMTVVKELFGQENPIGKTVKINLNNFRVVGVLPVKGTSGPRDQDDALIVPVTTAMYRLLGKQYVDSIYAEVVSPELMEEAQEAIRDVIKKRHRLVTKDQQNSFSIFNMSDIKDTLTSTTQTMSLLLGSIAAISLLVGGIGIMNIMLVSVTERTKEIGLRKAIGANNKDILIQFLIEAILMSLIGGLAGVALGSGVALLITLIAGWSVKVSVMAVCLSVFFSLVVGVVFGLWPARQASFLNPIEALRYE